jgi:pre-rRNA-processing protein TSR4
MPNLINVLRAQGKGDGNAEEPGQSSNSQEVSQTEEERKKKDLEVKLNAGMEWGTCLIYSCEKDCCEEEEGWREEIALIQWDE